MEHFRPSQISFIGEQDGDPEKDLKVHLAARFQSDLHVAKAYLVRVYYGEAREAKVALCIAAGDEIRGAILEAVGHEFRKMFKTTQSMDVLFLSPEQQTEIESVAKPFYKQHLYRT